MYDEFYKLSGLPFQLTPDHTFFFGSRVHKRAMAHLTYGISQGEGFIVVTGEVGAGKTTLVGHILSTLVRTKYVAATVVTTQLDADDMLRMVASAFGIGNESDSKAGLITALEDFFKDCRSKQLRCLLFVDEAQNLSVEALEELRMLSNFQEEQEALLQSFLLGQPQFRRTLARKELDQLKQRIIASYHLGPMSADETGEYIRHRLSNVGWDSDPRFSEDAFDEIHKRAGGLPRKINVLCSRILLYGFLDELHAIDRNVVVQVAEPMAQEFESILDHSVEAVPAIGGAAVAVAPRPTNGSGGAAVTHLPTAQMAPPAFDTSGLQQRVEAIESRVQHHERTLHMLLQFTADCFDPGRSDDSKATKASK